MLLLPLLSCSLEDCAAVRSPIRLTVVCQAVRVQHNQPCHAMLHHRQFSDLDLIYSPAESCHTAQGFFTSGYFVEDKEANAPNYLRSLERKKVLSNIEQLGLLSAAEKAGLSLSKVSCCNVASSPTAELSLCSNPFRACHAAKIVALQCITCDLATLASASAMSGHIELLSYNDVKASNICHAFLLDLAPLAHCSMRVHIHHDARA